MGTGSKRIKKRERRARIVQKLRNSPILTPSGGHSGSSTAAKHIYYLCAPVRQEYYKLQVEKRYQMECRLNRRGTAGYAPQLVNNSGDKMIRLQTHYTPGAAAYRTAVYEIVHSKYTGQNPAITYAKHLPEAVKTFLLGEYGTQKANPQGRAWTIFRLGKLLFEGSKEGFEAWHEALGTCDMTEIDDNELE